MHSTTPVSIYAPGEREIWQIIHRTGTYRAERIGWCRVARFHRCAVRPQATRGAFLQRQLRSECGFLDYLQLATGPPALTTTSLPSMTLRTAGKRQSRLGLSVTQRRSYDSGVRTCAARLMMGTTVSAWSPELCYLQDASACESVSGCCARVAWLRLERAARACMLMDRPTNGTERAATSSRRASGMGGGQRRSVGWCPPHPRGPVSEKML
eukprot:COSAG03_NODE_460_length_7745_cov_5.112346_10_plen_211_part_00